MARIDRQAKAIVGAVLGGLAAGFSATLGVVAAKDGIDVEAVLAGLAAAFTTASGVWTAVYFTPNSYSPQQAEGGAPPPTNSPGSGGAPGRKQYG